MGKPGSLAEEGRKFPKALLCTFVKKAGTEFQGCRNEVEEGKLGKGAVGSTTEVEVGSVHVGGGERLSVLTKKAEVPIRQERVLLIIQCTASVHVHKLR